jgi:hypothetical protein
MCTRPKGRRNLTWRWHEGGKVKMPRQTDARSEYKIAKKKHGASISRACAKVRSFPEVIDYIDQNIGGRRLVKFYNEVK